LDRIEHEMESSGRKISPLLLVVADITRKAGRSCGRGSAAASIVSTLWESPRDPIKHRLFFERFLIPADSILGHRRGLCMG